MNTTKKFLAITASCLMFASTCFADDRYWNDNSPSGASTWTTDNWSDTLNGPATLGPGDASTNIYLTKSNASYGIGSTFFWESNSFSFTGASGIDANVSHFYGANFGAFINVSGPNDSSLTFTSAYNHFYSALSVNISGSELIIGQYNNTPGIGNLDPTNPLTFSGVGVLNIADLSQTLNSVTLSGANGTI